MFEISVQMTKNKAISEISLVLVPANIFWYWQIFFGTGKYFFTKKHCMNLSTMSTAIIGLYCSYPYSTSLKDS